MERESKERRLAAILSADVVGYSRLIEIDETRTLSSLKSHRDELIDPAINAYNGRVVKLMGDGILAEFGSAVRAVECALTIQREMALRNVSVPLDSRIVFRVGVNLGDVVVEGDDVYGEGVNVAARLQEVAERGGIYISGPVFDQIEGKVDQHFSDLGNQQLKNIKRPVRVYCARLMEISASRSFRPFFDLEEPSFKPVFGGCLCGAIRYQISAPAMDVTYCHCRMCQRFTGGTVVTGAFFSAEALTFMQGQLKFYQSSPIGERGFCDNCGSSILFRSLAKQKFSGSIWVLVASLDEPEKFIPSWHLGIESQMPWLDVRDELPRVRCKDSPAIVSAWKAAGLPVPEPNAR